MGGWVGGGMDTIECQKRPTIVSKETYYIGMDTNIYIACPRQVVTFAPKVIIACL
jgi:hypothetical protein